MSGWRLEHSYSALPALFHRAVQPTAVAAPRLVAFDRDLAAELGLDAAVLASDEGAALFAGNRLPTGAVPLAQAYAGHQFGHFTGLGDGRAILLGEQLTPGGTRVDVQLKGAGPTPYSRRGDGRAALGPMLREFLISGAMHALGIPTSRSLAVAATGELVLRERALAGAVLTRVASSHLRVGTFEWAAAHRDPAALDALTRYALERHYPDAVAAPVPARALFEAVVERQARLIAQWQLVGFVHGVMNTDNMTISGETLDYGPCAFLDRFDPETVFSSIDAAGRYAYGNQPPIAQWNLARLAEALLPVFDADQSAAIEFANHAIARFEVRYRHHWLTGMKAKLGLVSEDADDLALAEALLEWMATTGADYTNTFRALSIGTPAAGGPEAPAFAAWCARWRARLERQPARPHDVTRLMQQHNPAVIPRNHLVEAALEAAADHDDLGPFERLRGALSTPYDHAAAEPEFTAAPEPGGRPYRTCCGT